MPTLKIRRAKEFADYLRSYTILLDGDKLGEIKNGETREFPISPGQHQLRMKIDWCGSMTIPFVAATDSEILDFSVRSNLKGSGGLAALYYLIFKPNEWIVVDREA
jgi:hypothetical protein